MAINRNAAITPAALSAGERRAEAMKQRCAGISISDIAEDLGVTEHRVRQYLRDVAKKNNAEAAIWNAVLVERNEFMWRKLRQKIGKGDMWAMDRGLQVLDRLKELTNAQAVASDAGTEIDRWLTGSVEDGGFEDDEDEILDVVDDYDDLEPEDLDEQLLPS